jgi:carnitine-CoA ligase
VCIAPFNADGIAFAERFGVEVYTAYNSTEMSTPLVAHPGFAAVPGICGRPRPGVQVRIVDEFDRELPDGEAGELIVRTDQPWTMTSGYHRMPEATVAVDELAMTPSGKVRKDVLRQQGATGAWDREAAGMVLKRERLS